jgi:hypothetical protein
VSEVTQRSAEDVVGTAGALAARWARPLLVLVAVALLPWTLWLGYSLPTTHTTHHYQLAWIGFDLALAAALAATALGTLRRSAWIVVTAAVAGTLLLCDAWFDVLTAASPRELVQALLLAGLCEIPLAALCFWIVWSAEHFFSRTEQYR